MTVDALVLRVARYSSKPIIRDLNGVHNALAPAGQADDDVTGRRRLADRRLAAGKRE
jgi:hypothetical protein